MNQIYKLLYKKIFWGFIPFLILSTNYQNIHAAPIGFNTNLIVNGEAVNNLTSWDISNGPTFITLQSAAQGLPERTGNADGFVFDYYPSLTTAPAHESISQTIDISGFSTAISAGNIKAVLSGNVFIATFADVSRIIIEQLDASDAVLATSQTDNSTLEYTWQPATITINSLNASTQKLRVTLYAEVNQPDDSFVEFDGIDLRLYSTPTITTTTAADITTTSVTLGGEVTSDGGAATSESGVVYSLTDATPTIAEGATKIAITAGGTGIFSQSISSLNSNTLYYYNAYSINEVGTSYGTANSFTTLAEVPTVVTDAASSITTTGATLNGSINANNASTVATFDYGLTTSYGTTVTADQSPVTGTSVNPVSKAITSLMPNTTYHYRVNGENSGGKTSGDDATFTTLIAVPDAPTIGTATAGDAQASVSFTAPAFNGGSEITGYNVTSIPEGLTGTGTASPIVVTGLTNGTAYTFTVTATNVAGTSVASAESNSVTPVASQVITFDNPGSQNFGTTPTLTATSTSGLAVTFSTTTPDVCSITPEGVLTFKTIGVCTINADQAGNAAYLPASTVSQSFDVIAVAPDAPTIGTATAGDAQASVSFTAPAFTGGSEITGYTVTSIPEGLTGTGTASPIVVTGLTNGTAYTFTVTATNIAGTSVASAESNSVTPAGLSTGLIDVTSGSLTFSPNPATDAFSLNVGEQTITVSLYNLNGTLMLTKQVTGKDYINISTLSKGVYVVKANGFVGKLVKK